MLYSDGEALVVQHDRIGGNVLVPGVERYASDSGAVGAVSHGDQISLWLSDDDLRVERLKIIAHSQRPAAEQSPLTGTVVRKDGTRLVLDHEAVPGVMGAMVMGFYVMPDEAAVLSAGDSLEGRLIKSDYGYQLVAVKKTGSGDPALREDVVELLPGELFPATSVPLEDGSAWPLGVGQGKPTLLSFVYTTCPDPEFCPALVSRLQALQEQVGAEARILTVTIDLDHDTPQVLTEYGRLVGAKSKIWHFGILPPAELQRVALLSGQSVSVKSGRISHFHRLLILDADGRLVERYDDNLWPMSRVVAQLRTGEPRGVVSSE